MVHEAILGQAADGGMYLTELQMQVVIPVHPLTCWLLKELSERLSDECGRQEWRRLVDQAVAGPNIGDGGLVGQREVLDDC